MASETYNDVGRFASKRAVAFANFLKKHFEIYNNLLLKNLGIKDIYDDNTPYSLIKEYNNKERTFTYISSGLSSSEYFEFRGRDGNDIKVRFSNHNLPMRHAVMHGFATYEIRNDNFRTNLDLLIEVAGEEEGKKIHEGFKKSSIKKSISVKKRIDINRNKIDKLVSRFAIYIANARINKKVHNQTGAMHAYLKNKNYKDIEKLPFNRMQLVKERANIIYNEKMGIAVKKPAPNLLKNIPSQPVVRKITIEDLLNDLRRERKSYGFAKHFNSEKKKIKFRGRIRITIGKLRKFDRFKK